jgi:flavodoxin
MKSMVVFESAYGNTEKIARAIAGNLGKYGAVTLAHAAEARAVNLYDFDLLIIGSPTQLKKASPTVGSWLDGISFDGLKDYPVAVFDTRYQLPSWRSGSAAQILAKRLQRLGAILIIDPESFFVTRTEGNLLSGELDRVPTWADSLNIHYKSFKQAKR